MWLASAPPSKRVRRFWQIRIVDRSELILGGGVVAEYEADELADDSDNKQKIEWAEWAAERKGR